MEIILPNKPGKHNYKQKYDLKKRRCPDLNQGSPVYYTGALNRRSLVQIRAVPRFQIILLFVIMFTRFIWQNDFHPLSTNSSGAVA